MSGARATSLAGRESSIQNVCMSGVLVQVRGVDPQVRDRLKARAAAAGMSLNSYLQGLLAADAALPSRAEVIERLRERGDLIAGDDPTGTVLDQLRRSREERTRHLMELSSADSGQDGGPGPTDR